MTEPKDTQQKVFDRRLVAIKRARAIRRANPSFLLDRVADDAVERICDVNRQFERALIMGLPQARKKLLHALPKNKKPKEVELGCFDHAGDYFRDEENLGAEPESFDLIISLLSLHTVNDLPGALAQIRKSLKPDGLFIGALFGGETLSQLRQACYGLDDTHLGGLTPRIAPFANHMQMAALLQRTGFALPVIDKDRVNVSYRRMKTLLEDLRDLGETNSLALRDKRFIGRNYLRDLYGLATQEQPFETHFDIYWMTGWAPHESQQKPLKPGSAQVSLTQVLADKSKI